MSLPIISFDAFVAHARASVHAPDADAEQLLTLCDERVAAFAPDVVVAVAKRVYSAYEILLCNRAMSTFAKLLREPLYSLVPEAVVECLSALARLAQISGGYNALIARQHALPELVQNVVHNPPECRRERETLEAVHTAIAVLHAVRDVLPVSGPLVSACLLHLTSASVPPIVVAHVQDILSVQFVDAFRELLPPRPTLATCSFRGDVFVALDVDGVPHASDDGILPRALPQHTQCACVVYAGGVFVIMTKTGELWRSADARPVHTSALRLSVAEESRTKRRIAVAHLGDRAAKDCIWTWPPSPQVARLALRAWVCF